MHFTFGLIPFRLLSPLLNLFLPYMSMQAKNLYHFSFSSGDSVVLEFKILASSYTNQMAILETQRKCKFVTWSRPSGYEVVFVLCWSECVPRHTCLVTALVPRGASGKGGCRVIYDRDSLHRDGGERTY